MIIIESSTRNAPLIDEMLDKLKQHPDFELLWLNYELALLLPGLEIDPVHRKVYCNNEEVRLTVKEYDLFCLLAANKGCVLTYEQIYRNVWKEEAFGNVNNAIKCHIRNLREKICHIRPDTEIVIRCMREVGYCLDVDSEKMAVTYQWLGKPGCCYFLLLCVVTCEILHRFYRLATPTLPLHIL